MTSTVLSGQQELAGFPVAALEPQRQEVSLEARQWLRDGLLHLQSGEAVGAVVAFSRSLECAADFAEAHIFLGIAHAMTSNIYPAIDHLEAAAKLEPGSFAAHYTMAQLHFKLRIPQKGYEAAEQARRCAVTVEQRKLLTELLRQEKGRERAGIARPWFYKPFSLPLLLLAATSAVALVVAFMTHMH